MAFTEWEQARIKHFLSYPDFVSLSQSVQLGYPAASQPLFLVEDAFKRLTPQGEETVRRDLCECEAIEKQLSQARSRFKAVKVDKLEVNQSESDQLRRELTYWGKRLAGDLGVNTNPYSEFEYQGAGGGGINARVQG
jgi:hypothetical protein